MAINKNYTLSLHIIFFYQEITQVTFWKIILMYFFARIEMFYTCYFNWICMPLQGPEYGYVCLLPGPTTTNSYGMDINMEAVLIYNPQREILLGHVEVLFSHIFNRESVYIKRYGSGLRVCACVCGWGDYMYIFTRENVSEANINQYPQKKLPIAHGTFSLSPSLFLGNILSLSLSPHAFIYALKCEVKVKLFILQWVNTAS